MPVNREYDVVVSKDGYQTTRRTLGVAEERISLTVEVRRTPAITVEADESRELVGNSVEVTVTDEYDDPVENASIGVAGTTVATTDADGRAEVPIRTAGTVSIAATAGDRSATTTVEGVEAAGEEPTTVAETTASPASTTAPETTVDESPPQTTGASGPGFGTPVAIVALVALAALLIGRSRR